MPNEIKPMSMEEILNDFNELPSVRVGQSWIERMLRSYALHCFLEAGGEVANVCHPNTVDDFTAHNNAVRAFYDAFMKQLDQSKILPGG